MFVSEFVPVFVFNFIILMMVDIVDVVVVVDVVIYLNQGYPALLPIDINRQCPEDRNQSMYLTFI